jgi:hypothetical protein
MLVDCGISQFSGPEWLLPYLQTLDLTEKRTLNILKINKVFDTNSKSFNFFIISKWVFKETIQIEIRMSKQESSPTFNYKTFRPHNLQNSKVI